MRKLKFKCKDSEFIETTLPLLKGKVFHITNAEGYKSICKDYAIKGNQDGTYSFSFSQSKNSYGRKRNYVCLVDLRDCNEQKVDDLLRKYGLNPHDSENPHFLILSPKAYDKIILWEQAQTEAGFNEMYIPYIECWYPGDIDLSLISKAIVVELTLCPPKYDGTFTSLIALAHWNEKHKK